MRLYGRVVFIFNVITEVENRGTRYNVSQEWYSFTRPRLSIFLKLFFYLPQKSLNCPESVGLSSHQFLGDGRYLGVKGVEMESTCFSDMVAQQGQSHFKQFFDSEWVILIESAKIMKNYLINKIKLKCQL